MLDLPRVGSTPDPIGVRVPRRRGPRARGVPRPSCRAGPARVQRVARVPDVQAAVHGRDGARARGGVVCAHERARRNEHRAKGGAELARDFALRFWGARRVEARHDIGSRGVTRGARRRPPEHARACVQSRVREACPGWRPANVREVWPWWRRACHGCRAHIPRDYARRARHARRARARLFHSRRPNGTRRVPPRPRRARQRRSSAQCRARGAVATPRCQQRAHGSNRVSPSYCARSWRRSDGARAQGDGAHAVTDARAGSPRHARDEDAPRALDESRRHRSRGARIARRALRVQANGGRRPRGDDPRLADARALDFGNETGKEP